MTVRRIDVSDLASARAMSESLVTDGVLPRAVICNAGVQVVALVTWLDQPITDPMQIRDVAELKLFFSELMGPDTERRLAADQIKQHTARLAEYHSIQERFADRADVASRMIPLELGIAMTEAALAFWVDLAERLDPED